VILLITNILSMNYFLYFKITIIKTYEEIFKLFYSMAKNKCVEKRLFRNQDYKTIMLIIIGITLSSCVSK